MNHPTPGFSLVKKWRARALLTRLRENSRHSVSCARENAEYSTNHAKRIRDWQPVLGVTRKVRVCSLHASSSLLTFHPTKKRACARLHADLNKGIRGCWYVFGMREQHTATQEVPSAALLFFGVGVRWVCSRDSAGTQKLPQGASFTTKLETCADSGPNGRAGRRAREVILWHIFYLAHQEMVYEGKYG